MEKPPLLPPLIDCKNFVHGNMIQAQEKLSEIKSPYTGKIIGFSYKSHKNEVHAAIESAKQAQILWAQESLRDRAQIFIQFKEWLLKNIDILSHTISSECGKLPKEARDEVLKGIEVTDYATSLLHHDTLQKTFVSRGVSCEYRREPLGVTVGITPSNFPAMVPLWMIPIAIMLGNSFILKPSERTPMASLLLAQGLTESGLPPGIFNVVQGDKVTVELLCTHPDVQAVGFVGSTPAAKFVYHKVTEQNKRALCLGGAKNHILLMPDAQPELAVDGIVASFTGCAGQRCMAASVLLAVGDVHSIIKQIAQKTIQIELVNHMGALISKESEQKLKIAIGNAQKEGAEVLVDGRKVTPPEEYKNGNWLGATILNDIKKDSQAACEELFGPVLSIIYCKNLSEAIAIENTNPYGNAASVFTDNGEVAEYVIRNARAGMIGVNVGIPVPREPFSFGGLYDSKFGHGDITGHGGIEFWSNRKKVTKKWALQSDKSWMS